jgi:radical SAM enzyme (TIGR01210 family)
MVKREVVRRLKELKNGYKNRKLLSYNDPNTPAFVETAPANVKGAPSERQLIAFRTPPCTHGKCTMCGFGSGAVHKISLENLRTQLDSIDLIQGGRVALCTESSFFHPQLPKNFLDFAFERIAKLPIQEVDLEACTSDVISNTDKIQELRNMLRTDQQLFVGMGLESRDAFVRTVLIGKDSSLDVFEKAVSSLADAGVGVYSYILLKPPGLGENEAINECIRTIKYFFEITSKLGVEHTRATLKPLFIPKDTMVETLFEEGLITPPKLWSLVRVLQKVHHLGNVFVPLTDENLAEGRLPGNCNDCTVTVREAIKKFSATQEIRPLNELKCECKSHWMEKVAEHEAKE